MRLDQLYIFRAVAETGSIRKAGERLFLTPQNLSKSMLQLEKEWNVTLYERSRTGIQLTAEGEKAYAKILPILAQVDELQNMFRDGNMEDDIFSPVSVMSCSVLETFAMGLININLKDYRDAPILVDKGGSGEINHFLMTETDPELLPDLVLTNLRRNERERMRKKTEANYSCFFLFEDELCLQVPADDPIAKLDAVPLDMLRGLPMLLYSSSPKRKTESEQILANWGYELKNVSRTSNLDITSQMAVNQHRYCFVGFPSVEFRPMSRVAYIPLERRISTDMIFLVKKKRKNKTLTDAFIRSMDESYDLKKIW